MSIASTEARCPFPSLRGRIYASATQPHRSANRHKKSDSRRIRPAGVRKGCIWPAPWRTLVPFLAKGAETIPHHGTNVKQKSGLNRETRRDSLLSGAGGPQEWRRRRPCSSMSLPAYLPRLRAGSFSSLHANSADPFPVHASAGESHRPRRRRRLVRVRPRSAHSAQSAFRTRKPDT